jgi:hypothetical protein
MKFRLSDGYCTHREIVHFFFRTITGIYSFLLFKKYFRFNIYFRDFLALVPQAGGANDHPMFTNFLQLYSILSTYNLLKSPQFGKCLVLDSDTKKSQIIKSMRKFGKK